MLLSRNCLVLLTCAALLEDETYDHHQVVKVGRSVGRRRREDFEEKRKEWNARNERERERTKKKDGNGHAS